MNTLKIITFLLFAPIILLSCSGSQNTDKQNEVGEETRLIQDIQKAVDNYFSVDDEDFLRSTFCGDYSEPFIGHVYEFVITEKNEALGEFNYMAQVGYDQSSETINIIKTDAYALADIPDPEQWIEDRKKKNDAKKVH